MIEIAKALSETSVPSLLMGLGGILLLLAFVQKIGTQIELPESRQKMAALTGSVLLVAGISVSVMPHLPERDGTSGRPDLLTGTVLTKDGTDIGPSPAEMTKTNDAAAPADDMAGGAMPDSEPVYTGSLPGLMPDLALLPDNLVGVESTEIDPAVRSQWVTGDPAAYRRFLARADFAGYRKVFDNGCEREVATLGPILHVRLVAYRFGSAEAAKLDHEWPRPEITDYLIRDEAPLDGYPSEFTERFGQCGETPVVNHYRDLRVGNVAMQVRIFLDDRQVRDPEIARLSERLIRSMAANIPGSGF